MSKKKKYINETQPSFPDQFRREIMGIIVLAIAGFLFFGNRYLASTGFIGKIVFGNILTLFIGQGKILLPLFIGFTGILLLFGRKIIREKTVAPGITYAFAIHLIVLELQQEAVTNTLILKPFFNHPGGILGYIITFTLKNLLGPTGIKIVVISSIFICFLLIFKVTILDILVFIKNVVLKIYELIISHKEKVNAEKSERIETEIIEPKKEKPNLNLKIEPVIFKEERKPQKATTTEQPKEQTITQKELNEIVRIESDNEDFLLPDLNLLSTPTTNKEHLKKVESDIQETIQKLEETLESFKVNAKVVNTSQGPNVTRYEIQPGFGVKVSRIVNLADDIALNLAAKGVRIEAPVPGKSVIGIEIPNKITSIVNMLPLAKEEKFIYSSSPLLIALGKDIEGSTSYLDLSKMPHLLVAGATGSGKSVCINSILISLLLRNTPSTVRFIMIDPKRVELNLYDDIPHLIAPVVTDAKKAAVTLRWCVIEMERRYEELAKLGVKNIEGFNQRVEELRLEREKLSIEEQQEFYIPKKYPYIVIVLDELADLMMAAASEVESSISRIAQMARAVGLHLVIATQRPSVDVITGLIKANVPSRISFAVSSQIDSRTILDSMGAEKLLGRGDMLYKPVGAMRPTRIQGVFLSDKEIHNIVDFVKRQGQPEYLQEVVDLRPEDLESLKRGHSISEDGDRDEFFEEAKDIILTTKKTSVSFIQRRLKIGYNRAARIMEEMVEAGIISEMDDSGKREILY
ncbi:MAG: DNA translocase FtsK 4TM domain-containing protein [Candidatus Riflemargulisbacteria bacterium]